MQNTDRTPPRNDAFPNCALADGADLPAPLVVELYEEPHETEQIPVVIMTPKGVPFSALHD